MTSPTTSGAGPRVCVFSPTPLLMVTIESLADGQDDVHFHAGGQGVWIANMLSVLGIRVSLCAPFGGETGGLLSGLLRQEELDVIPIQMAASNGCYVEDRRSGEAECVSEMPAAVLDRHESDDLLNHTLTAALDAELTILTGPSNVDAVATDVYRRLAKDLAALNVPVVADLSGDPLTAALEGGLSVLKVSHEDLAEDGRTASEELNDLVDAMRTMSKDVGDLLVVTRAHAPAIALVDGDLLEVKVPSLQRVDHRGAGDSLTAGITAALARKDDRQSALRLGAAAGTVNVTRHGLASGQRETITRIADHVVVQPLTREKGESQ